jgi:heterogeneous nuclear rnp K-like protein 2
MSLICANKLASKPASLRSYPAYTNACSASVALSKALLRSVLSKSGVVATLTLVAHRATYFLQAYSLIISQLLEPESTGTASGVTVVPPSHTSLRLLISHNLMGTIIGRQGLKIKAIQDASGARMIASKDMLPQSTERIVEVQGTAEGIGRAVEEIGRCLLEDWERGLGTVLYHPGAGGSGARISDNKRHATSSNTTTGPSRRDGGRTGNGVPRANGTSGTAGAAPAPPTPPPSSPPTASAPNGASNPRNDIRTQNISIPSDMVGCIIGRGGTKITEIRRLSGSKISIAKTPHDETGERMFTIIGTAEANEKALFLLYNQLESEKERRVGKELVE